MNLSATRSVVMGIAMVSACALSFAKEKEEKVPVLVNARHLIPGGDKEHPAPAPGKPVYYFPISGGYVQRGPAIAGDPPLDVKEVWPVLQKALAAHGYLLVGKGTPMPSLILTFHWGAMNPDKIDQDVTMPGADGSDETISSETISNLREMMALTGGNRMDNFLSMDRDLALERASEDRYFVVVSAWDFAAATAKPRKKVLVWQTSLSVPSAHTSLAAAIRPMINSGAASFGKDERLPVEVDVSFGKGKVELGPLEVIDNPGTTPSKPGEKKKR